MSIHEGHRARMKNRFRKNGLSNMEPHEVLEIMLYYCIPRSDTNEIAHKLIKRYKTLGGVLQATPQELQSIEGIGENTTFFLSLLNDFVRYVNVERTANIKLITGLDDCVEYVRPLFDGISKERAYLLCLDAKSSVLGCHLLCEGSVTSTRLSAREVVEFALNARAASVILVHNHPGGLALPSAEDIDTTNYLASILEGVKVRLVDHIIISDKDYLSMARIGILNNQ